MYKKKVLIILWHIGIGGMQKRICDMVEDKTFKADIFLIVKRGSENDFLYKRLIKNKNVKISIFSKRKWFLYNLFFMFWVIFNTIKYKPDVCLTFLDHISVFMSFFKKIGILGKCKLVINESMMTTKYIEMQRGIFSKLWKYLVKIMYKNADVIIVPTKSGFKDLNEN